MFNKKNNSRGFTLIEIVVSIAVVAIIGVAFFAFFANSARLIKETDIREKALMVAQQEMEIAKAKQFPNITTNTDKNFPSEEGFPDYTADRIVKNISSSLKEIKITVNWENKSISITSYISER